MPVDPGSAPHRPLRIAFYSTELPESGIANGIVTYTRIMRDALRAIGHSVMIVTPRFMENLDGSVLPLAKTNRLLGRGRYMLEKLRPATGANPWVTLQVLEAFRAARRAGVEIFEIEESFGWAARLSGHGIPIVERLHGPHTFVRDNVETPEQKRLGDLRETAELKAFLRVQAITSPTQRLLDALRDRFGVSPQIARAIPNPIPIAINGHVWSATEADPNQILFVGRFDSCKGADIIIHAFRLALGMRPNLSLVMVGPDYGISEANRAPVHYDEFITRVPTDVRRRIQFLGAQRPSSVAKLRMKSGLAIVASRFENFPYSIAEAMAVGMPIICTDTFGGREMVRNGIDGLVVPVGDSRAMANAIIAMTTERDRMAAFGHSAHLRAAEWLSPERVVNEAIDVYRKVLGAQSARRA